MRLTVYNIQNWLGNWRGGHDRLAEELVAMAARGGVMTGVSSIARCPFGATHLRLH